MYIPRYIGRLTPALQAYQTDVLIIGGGIAGLYLALKLSEQLQCTVVTKAALHESNSSKAQGGMAAALASFDSPALHLQDTLIAGAGLCETEPVRVLVEESKAVIEDLISLGISFDRDQAGELALTQEGAHQKRRILHAGGDATGKHIIDVLVKLCQLNQQITILEHAVADDLILVDRCCTGAIITNQAGQQLSIQARATVLATGGIGQLYARTTNPMITTGDGIALALRAGAELQDLEFVQFHPTALALDQAPSFLISEAVRGEGAILRNEQGERFMTAYHPQAELAPRDIVARAIHLELHKSKKQAVYLDIKHLSEAHIQARFPTIYSTCLSFGINPGKDLIPISPAAHYMMGGVRINLTCETSIPALFACGEVACTGLHGANRLASNSLTEAVVFGRRLAIHLLQKLQQDKQSDKQNVSPLSYEELFLQDRQLLEQFLITYTHNGDALTAAKISAIRLELQERMLLSCGIVRNKRELKELLEWLEQIMDQLIYQLYQVHNQTRDSLHKLLKELYSMVLTAFCVVTAALERRESRGAHYRIDFPEQDIAWMHHLVYARDEETGQLKERKVNVTQ